LNSLPDNAAGNFDFGWLGQRLRPLESEAGLATFEMGARPYVSAIGRFLEADPIEGGSANTYEYAMQDPCNRVDLDGNAAALIVLAGAGVGIYTSILIARFGYHQARCTLAANRLHKYRRRLNRRLAAKDLVYSEAELTRHITKSRHWKEMKHRCPPAYSAAYDFGSTGGR
jgi:RHS repeat-associated protein